MSLLAAILSSKCVHCRFIAVNDQLQQAQQQEDAQEAGLEEGLRELGFGTPSERNGLKGEV